MSPVTWLVGFVDCFDAISSYCQFQWERTVVTHVGEPWCAGQHIFLLIDLYFGV
jgi:hypothetical protein